MRLYEIVGSSDPVIVSGRKSRLENATLGYVGRLTPRLAGPILPTLIS